MVLNLICLFFGFVVVVGFWVPALLIDPFVSRARRQKPLSAFISKVGGFCSGFIVGSSIVLGPFLHCDF